MSLIPAPIHRGVDAVLAPIVDRLIAARVTPNAITTVGTLVLLGSAGAFATGLVRLGGALLLLSGVLDMLDGKVARLGGRVTPFGAFYDSTLDRVGESALFGGIGLYFLAGGVALGLSVWAVAAAITALASGLIVSYARARAEGLGLDCKVGVAQRAERILGLGVPSLLFGPGPGGLLLLGITAVLAALSVITVVQRMVHVYKLTNGAPPTAPSVRERPALADTLVKGRRGG